MEIRRWPIDRYRKIYQLCGLVVVIISVIALIGWFSGLHVLSGIRSEYIPMAPNTSLCFIALGIGLSVGTRVLQKTTLFLRIPVIFTMIFAVIRLAEYITASEFGVDQWVFNFQSEISGLPHVGKMAVFTSLNFIFSGTAMFLLSVPQRPQIIDNLSRAMAGVVTFIGLTFSLGYFYGAPLFYSGQTIPMALNTAISFLVLGAGLVVFASIREISERKETEELKQRSEEELERQVKERINQLTKINESLSNEIIFYEREEEGLKKQIMELEHHFSELISDLDIANLERELFSCFVSHDLSKLLRTINNLNNMLLNKTTDQLNVEDKSTINHLSNIGLHMRRYIDDLICLILVSHREMSIESVNLSEIVRSITDDINKTHTNTQLKINIRENLVIKGDYTLLRLALNNLLGNLINNISNNKETTIEFGSAENGGIEFYYLSNLNAFLNISDDGILFRKFNQPYLRNYSENDLDENDIKILISQRIIYRHGGRIWADVSSGQAGSLYFTISLQ